MNSIPRIISAAASSLLLAAGFSRLAEQLDPMAAALNERSEGLMNEADACSVPTMIATFSAR